MTPRTTDLIARLEIATHAERIREMMAQGRLSRADAQAAATLAELAASGNFYERLLALHACYATRDGETVLRFLDDPSRILRGSALRLVPLACTDEQVVSVLQAALPKVRLVLLRRLRKQKRTDAIDNFLGWLAADDDAVTLGELLVYGSPNFVRRYLAQFVERFSETDWRRLARAHPDIAVEQYAERLRQQTEADPRLLTHLNAVLAMLSDRRPTETLELVRFALRYENPSRLDLQRLAERRPNEIADLALSLEDALPISLGSVASRLSKERLLALLQSRPATLSSLRHEMKRLAPSFRTAVYVTAGDGWKSKDGMISDDIVAVLPTPLREPEARRQLALPSLQTQVTTRLAYARFLPWDEAEVLLGPYIKNPDADMRSAALSALIGAARYHRDRLADVLALIRARNNEQDPVRCALLRAVAALPPSRWQPEHLSDLGLIIRDALDASDLSATTAGIAESLIIALVPFQPEWAAQWLGTLVKERGHVSFYGLGERLSNEDVRRIAPALLPVFTSWRTNERQQNLVAAARAFAKRLEVFPAFGALLEDVTKNTKQSYVVSQILDMLRRYQTERFKRLVPYLLTTDKSVVTLPVVYTYLHQKRQDLITPFLGQQAYSGRFSTGRTRFVLPLLFGFARWTARQQAIFAETLDRVSRDTSRDTPAIAQVIRQLSALPAVPPTRLVELAGGAGVRSATRDLALQALARLDAGQGVPMLVEALGDDRARIAIYALRSAVLEMPADRALALLQNAPTQKVTVAKEVVRLLGDLRTPRTLPLLLEMAQTTLHRDVRVALLRALWEHVEQEDTWPILNAAAKDPDAAVARGVVRIPVARLSFTPAARLRTLLAMLLEHSDVQVRLDALQRCTGFPVADPDRVLLPPLLARLSSPLPGEVELAAQAVFGTYGANDAAAVAATAGQIRNNRQALRAFLYVMRVHAIQNRRHLLKTTRAVLAVLAADPLTARSRAELAVAGLGGVELADYLATLTRSGELHAEALMAAVDAIESAHEPIPPELSGAETILAAAPEGELRRLALACLVTLAKTTGGWTAERRARHAVFCQDPSPLVAAAAQFTELPPQEV